MKKFVVWCSTCIHIYQSATTALCHFIIGKKQSLRGESTIIPAYDKMLKQYRRQLQKFGNKIDL
jgi:hypothetical protein